MKCQILFSGKNKKNNIILSSAENAQRVVKVKIRQYFMQIPCLENLHKCEILLSRKTKKNILKYCFVPI